METMKVTLSIFALALSLAILVPCFQAQIVDPVGPHDKDETLSHIAQFDDYWKNRSQTAKSEAEKAFDPNPELVTDTFNSAVQKATEAINGTRRHLDEDEEDHEGEEECMATNPIDRCWRCKKNWAKNRKRLAGCVLGFGRKTRGGKAGKYYIVTDASDHDVVNPKPGTLRHAVIQTEPLWIYFARSMIIRLKEELIVTSDKTIDGRGASVHIAYGAGIMIQFVKNVIIHNLYIHDIVPKEGGLIRDAVDHFGFRTRSDGDGISIFGSSNIWIDHISMRHCDDGLIDAVAQSTAITISNCHFTHHTSVMLLGGSDFSSQDKVMQVTLAFNHFGKGLVHRMPRCRWGFFHVVNNDYTHWLMYAIGGSAEPTIISQGNRFIAPPNPNCKQVTNRYHSAEEVWKNWTWRSEDDLFLNGAFFVESGEKLKKKYNRKEMIKNKPGSAVRRLTRYAGAIKCQKNKEC